jgi:hypothetical protein
MRRRLFAIILLLALPLLGVVVATPASAQTTPTVDVTSATLVARGAAVDVRATVTCEAGSSAFLGVNVRQRSGNRIAQGGGSKSFTCTGLPQTITVRVGNFTDVPFRVGEALVETFLQACNGFECQSVETSETVRIRP